MQGPAPFQALNRRVVELGSWGYHLVRCRDLFAHSFGARSFASAQKDVNEGR
ncbi:hypothetical protein FTUN_6034 [Frigoriglobus tundricola]|uniref:Uncharacterized protein n=1 Tax=Frigoriglobus tundricola TaxID=2774151 RepID=A0A6M5YY50_9BACT|nr:hypothetical protein FTUN_6034 [Frigoriglobus tundricola]